MSGTIKAGAWTIEVLTAGEQLEGGGTVATGQVAIRVNGHELAGRPEQIAELGRQLFHQFGNGTLPSETWQILAVGDAVTGLKFHGPFLADDPDGRADARICNLEIDRRTYVRAGLQPLEDLPPIDPDPSAAGSTAAVSEDVDIAGAGTLKAGTTYLATRRNGVTVCCYALAGRDLVEAHEFHNDCAPNWSTASICESGRGEEDFYYPAVALLRYLNDRRDLPVWHHSIRAEFDAMFTAAVKTRLIAGWSHDEVSGGYRITVWQQDGTTAHVVLRTPGQTTVFIAGIRAAVTAPPVTP